LFCDEMRHADAVVARVNAACAQGPFDASSVRSHLDSLVENRLMVTDGAHYLSLAIVEPRTAARARPLRDGAAA
jgi:hypothetical protein